MVLVLAGLSTEQTAACDSSDSWNELRRQRAPIEKHAAPLLLLHHDFWLEGLDTKHRYGFHLRLYHDIWKAEMQDNSSLLSDADRSFFYWLDNGNGSQLELPECSRAQLNTTCVQYCSPHQRYSFEVYCHRSTASTRLYFASSHALVETDELSKWIFVMSRDGKLYVARKNKGFFHHSSFLAGAPIAAAGKVFVTAGVLHAVEPHSGHFKPRLASLSALCQMLEGHGVDMSNIHITKPRKWKDPWPYPLEEEDSVEIGQSDSEYS